MIRWLMDWAGLRNAHALILAAGMGIAGWVACYLTSWYKARREAETEFWKAARETYQTLAAWEHDELVELHHAVHSALLEQMNKAKEDDRL